MDKVKVKGNAPLKISSTPDTRAGPNPHASYANRYAPAGGWLYPRNTTPMPTRSVIPHPDVPGAWVLGDIPTPGNTWANVRNIQGWKLHVSVHPEDQKIFFDALAPMLFHSDIAHKFLPYATVEKQDLSTEGYDAITATNNENDGKSLTIYPKDPCHLMRVADRVLAAIVRHNADALRKMMEMREKEGLSTYRASNIIREHPFGIKGDLRLSKYPFMFTRYGGFEGPNAMANQVFNTKTRSPERDLRYEEPYNDFARNIPTQIRAML